MRELKFRAWDKEDKRIVGPFSLSSLLGRCDTGLINLKDWDDVIDADELEWMQYTGLKDKNGREIYEGDIMRDTHGNHREEHQVYWAKSMGAWACDIGEEWGDMSGSYTWEVIGNIYENPGLLGENGSLGKT